MAFALGVRYVLLRKEKHLIPYRQDQTFLIYWIMEESRQTICPQPIPYNVNEKIFRFFPGRLRGCRTKP